ncbi:hypothetical protein KIPE111705_32170 [Kibdelosporangium persicum]|uniref:2,3,4,5-tetrahydropyridine-2,6-dicarboxylate N-succinyltransferase n=1 Tax=Kibdelosporangium persicum TaxID=2698649 RepID=A0ABX2F9X3_9PSEU|nr:hypothetical protein [Kibdelosporangium persicum]NRN67730.1 2,3,4,5-tetrahydropyridine-2,6-dicarboxylate N-succinyltransferase [Kibdelosporangium persicum]
MSVRNGFRLAGLLLVSAALAAVELLYLPLRFDGAILPMAGGLPFPISAVVAAVTLPRLVKRASRVSPRLLVAGSPLWIWLLCVLASAFPGPGGDVVLVGDWRALLLLGCGALAGAVSLGGMLGRQTPPPTGKLTH